MGRLLNAAGQGISVIGVLLLAGGIIVVVPLAAIWAINSLFLTGIPYTAKTWAAVMVLIVLTQSGRGSS